MAEPSWKPAGLTGLEAQDQAKWKTGERRAERKAILLVLQGIEVVGASLSNFVCVDFSELFNLDKSGRIGDESLISGCFVFWGLFQSFSALERTGRVEKVLLNGILLLPGLTTLVWQGMWEVKGGSSILLVLQRIGVVGAPLSNFVCGFFRTL